MILARFCISIEQFFDLFCCRSTSFQGRQLSHTNSEKSRRYRDCLQRVSKRVFYTPIPSPLKMATNIEDTQDMYFKHVTHTRYESRLCLSYTAQRYPAFTWEYLPSPPKTYGSPHTYRTLAGSYSPLLQTLFLSHTHIKTLFFICNTYVTLYNL